MYFNCYRGRTNKSKQWITGWFLYSEEKPIIFTKVGRGYEVSAETVGQLVLEEDGKTVYEGDILYDELSDTKWLISYSPEELRYTAKPLNPLDIEKPKSGNDLISLIMATNVIANRWDNPELLPATTVNNKNNFLN